MNPRLVRILVGTVWLITISAFVSTFLLEGRIVRTEGKSDETLLILAFSLVPILFSTVGAFTAARRPRNPIGWIMCAVGLGYAVAGFFSSYTHVALHGGNHGLIILLLGWTTNWLYFAALAPAATYLLLLFPDGRLPSRRWRIAAIAAALGTAFILLSSALRPGPLDEFPQLRNPIGLQGAGWVLSSLGAIGGVAFVVSLVAAVASVVVRYRRAPRPERRQIKWLMYGGLLIVVAAAAAALAENLIGGEAGINISNAIVSAALAILPITIGVAILKHRLYDIDVIINRTLVYGVLTASLLAFYLLVVVTLSRVLEPVTRDSDVAVAASTLAVAAVFGPLRSWIQGFIDRRFYRRKYDSAEALHRFAERLRSEIEVEAVRVDVLGVVGTTLQPSHASVWINGGADR